MTAAAALLPRATDAHGHLRRKTHSTHLRLHQLPQFLAIEAGTLSLVDYAELLGGLHAYHGAIAAAAKSAGLAEFSSSPHRLTKLEADLAAIGGTPSPATMATQIASTFEALGAIYVAEGSALGGRVIARQLDYLFGGAVAGRSFFAGDQSTGRSWRKFLDHLQHEASDPADFPQLVAGAEASFALFERCVTR